MNNSFEDIKEQYDVVLFIPEMNEYLGYSEGTGDNLLSEDRAEGFVDYIDFTQYDEDCEEIDGGIYMMKEFFKEKYPVEDSTAPELIEFVYGQRCPFVVKKGFLG